MLSDDDINDVLERVYGFRLERWELEEGGGPVMELSRAIESAACAERDARIAELTQQLEEARKDAERWNWLNWHIGVAWGEEGFTSLIRIVSEKHRALINTQIDKLMSGELPETPAIRAAIKEQT